MKEDVFFMKKALKLARKAGERGEVPVGALVVKEGILISEGFNKREGEQNPLGHAELEVLQKASKKLGSWRLSGCKLYVTLEPCLMCTGALMEARIEELVYGASDLKKGCIHSLYQLPSDPRLHHSLEIKKGVEEEECSLLIKKFFQKIRKA